MDDIFKDVAAIGQIEAIPTILDVLCRSSGMGFAAVARVTESRWVACEVLDNIDFGLRSGDELPIATTICNEIRVLREEVVIDHVAEDPVYAAHHTPRTYGFQSYISVPIVLANGELFGTLCAIDPQPRPLKGSAVPGMFRLFAQLIAFHIDAHQRLANSRSDLAAAQEALRHSNAHLASSQAELATSEASLLDATTGAELREQFIAVLGHDLRNPLAGLEGGRRMLANMHDDPKSARVLRLMGESITRMSGLIENLMDFARGRLGGGIGLELSRGQRIEPLLAQVVNEMRAGHPERQIETRFAVSETIDVDQSRLAQMLSNLLGNAIAHGAHDQPIVVHAAVDGGIFELTVANGGDPIPDQARERLFQPFYRGEIRPSLQGLGLGLYIASQIAQAHGGELQMTSDAEETRFTFTMPIDRSL